MFNQAYILSYIIGVIFAYQLPRALSLPEVSLLIFFFGLGLFVRTKRLAWFFRFVFALILGVSTVFVSVSYHQKSGIAPELWQLPTKVNLQVQSRLKETGYYHRYEVESFPSNRYFSLIHYDRLPVMEAGRCYSLTLKFKPKQALGNPTTLYQAKQLWLKKEFYRATVVNREPIVEISCPKKIFDLGPLREELLALIDRSSATERAKGLIEALVLGERGGISQQDQALFQKTGTAHLLAISGLHIGLIFGFFAISFSLILRPFCLVFLRFNLMLLASGIALMASGFYVLLSGSGISSIRAWGMLALITVLLWQRQHIPLLSVLLMVVGLILLVDPLAGLGMGLWLSAGAVFALIWLKAGAWDVHWKLPFMMAPMTSVWMQSAWIGPIANGIAIPFVSFFVVPGSLISVFMIFFDLPGAESMLRLTSWLIEILWEVLSALEQFALTHHWTLLSFGDTLLYMGLILLLLLPWRLFGIFPYLILTLALSLPTKNILPPGVVNLDVMDSGQATAIWVQVEDKHLLFDAGGYVAAGYLKHHRVKNLDVIVVSHNDMDHRAGLQEVLENLSVKTLYTGERLSEYPEADQVPCLRGQAWTWGEVNFEFLFPFEAGGRGNNASCVLRISTGDTHVLLTGDIESKAERALLTETEPSRLQAHLLLAPHHGSRTSSTQAFVEAVSPNIVIYPTGYMNAYRHPHPDIVNRYAAIGAKQYNTAQDGALHVKLSQHGIQEIQCFNQLHQRWWHQSKEASCSGYLVQAGS